MAIAFLPPRLRPRLARVLGSSHDALQAPLIVDLVLVGTWAALRTLEIRTALPGWLVVTVLVGLRWPATPLAMLGIIALFPPGPMRDVPFVLAVGAGIGSLAWLARQRRRIRVDVLVVLVAVVAAASGLALVHSITTGPDELLAGATGRWTGLATGLLALPVFVFMAGRGAFRPFAFVVVAAVVAIGLAVLATVWRGALADTPIEWLIANVRAMRATGPFLSPNRLGTVAGIAFVAAGYIGLTRRNRRWPWLAVAVLATAGLALSFSRGAALGVALAAIVIVARRSLRAAFVVGAGIALVAGLIGSGYMTARFGPDSSGALPAEQARNDAGRVSAWLAGARMFIAAPITGHGYGSYAWLGPRYGGSNELRAAHNDVIGLLAETGIAGGVGYALLLVASGLRATRPRTDLGEAALGTLIVLAVATSFNAQAAYPEVMIPAWAMIGMALGDATRAARVSRRMPRAAP